MPNLPRILGPILKPVFWPITRAEGGVWDGNIRTEGDSLMDGAYGVALNAYIASLVPQKLHTDTAVGGATMTEIRDRVLDPANSALRRRTTIFWDGSQNGITTVSEYADLLAQAIAALGHNNFVVVPPINPYGSTYAGSQQQAIAAEFLSRWPNNFLHWQDWLTNTSGSIAQGEFYNAPTDSYHLSASGAAHMAMGIYQFLRSKGWITGDADDPALTTGSLWLFDPGIPKGAFAGVPANASVKPNAAWEYAAAVFGSGDATTLGTYVEIVNTASDFILERTSKLGLHAILSQNSAYVGNTSQGVTLVPPLAIQNYLEAHVEDDWYFSIWFLVTRKPIDPPGGTPAVNVAPQSIMHKAENTSNLLFHMDNLSTSAKSGNLGALALPSAQAYSAVTLGAPLLRAVGTTSYKGTKPALGGSPNFANGLRLVMGSNDAWSYFNNGAAPSIALYRAYAECLTLSGRTYAQASAMDTVLWNGAFGAGGRFASDSYTDPATLP